MISRKLGHGFVAGLLAALAANGARAVDYLPETVYESSDAQFFSPLDVDFDGLPINKECGYFFSLDKTGWVATGERTRIGTADGSDASMNPYRLVHSGGGITDPDPVDDSNPLIFSIGQISRLPQPVFLGGLDSTPSDAEFAWGERYELGYRNEEVAYLMSIIDGPTVRSGATYGFGLTGQDDTVGGAIPSRFPLAPGQLINPLGSVLIVFDDPQNLMFGFLDVQDDPETAGPPGAAFEDDDNGDGVLDGDGSADDIDEDGQHGPDGWDFQTPAWDPDTRIIGVPPDLEDIIRLPTTFQFVDVRNSTETLGFELMKSHRLNNNGYMAKHQNNAFDVFYGARFLRLRDTFNVNTEGGVLGRSFWDTKVQNNLVGPQFGMNWHHQRQRFGFDFNGRCMLAYNNNNFEQISALGEDLITGQLNHPLWFQPTYASHGKTEDFFSPTVELRTEMRYQVSGAFALKLGYAAIFIDNISRAAQQVHYELPRMGFKPHEAGEQEILINGFNGGFEVVY